MDNHVAVAAGLEDRGHRLAGAAGEDFDADHPPLVVGVAEEKDFVAAGLGDRLAQWLDDAMGKGLLHGTPGEKGHPIIGKPREKGKAGRWRWEERRK